MVEANVPKNQWFKAPQEPFTDIAYMLMELDGRGLLPDDMRQVIRKHAENCLDVLPTTIASVAASLASAVASNVGLNAKEIEGTSWGLAALGEQAHGWKELYFFLDPENKLP